MKTSIITLSATLSLISGLFADPASNKDLKQFADAEVTQAAITEALDGQKDQTTIKKLPSPISIKSLDEAAKYFNRATLEKIAEDVDFETQEVLLFIWQGASQDLLSASVLESSPIQVKFKYKYTTGRTKDLKTHVAAYAKPLNAKWSVTPHRVVFRCGVGDAGNGAIEIQPGGPRLIGPRNNIRIKIQPGGPPIQIPLAPEEAE